MTTPPGKDHTTFIPLREHPLMSRRGISNWPPVWTNSTKEDPQKIYGEVGVLRYIHLADQASKKCYLVIEYNRERYVGSLSFDDTAFCSQICRLLQQHIGRSVKEIGDSDVSLVF